MSLGRLVVDLVANSAEFIQGIDKATMHAKRGVATMTSSFGTLVKAQLTADLAMQAASAAIGYFTASIEKAGAAIDSAASFGSLPEKFYNIQYAVESAGDSFEPVSKAMGTLSKELSEMGSTAEGKGQLIKALGLDLGELKRADPADAIKTVAQALQGIEDPTTRARVGTALLGKAYKDAAPGLLALAEAGTVQTGVSQAMLESADSLGDAFGRVKAQGSNLAVVVTGTLAPQLLKLGEALLGSRDNSAALGATLASGLSPILTGIAHLVNVGSAGLKMYALSLAGAGAAVKAIGTGDLDALKAIPGQWKAGAIGIANDAKIAQKTIEQASRGVTSAEKARADQHGKTKTATDSAATSASNFDAILAKLGGAGKAAAAVDPITQAFQRVREEILKTKLEGRDFEIAKFASMKGISKSQVQKFTLLVDTLEAEKSIKTFRDETKNLGRELELVGKSDFDASLANFKTKLEDAKVPAEQVTEAVAKMRELLEKRADFAFAKDLESLRNEIAKIGLPEQKQAEIDIRTKYKDDPTKQAEMLAENTRKYSKLTEEQVSEMMRKLEAEAASISATPLTLYVQELQEARRLNPLITNEVITTAAKLKEQNLELAKTYQENKARGEEAAQTISSGLGAILRDTENAADGFRNLTQAVADLILKYAVLQPMENALKGLFTSGSSGGGIIDSLVSGISTFFGSGRALGGGVGANSLHEVVEQGPELLAMGGKTYLMTGAQGGNVIPLEKGGSSGGGSTVINQYFTIDASGADAGVDERIRQAMRATKEETLAAVQAQHSRGAILRR